ncbi:unnamed protein product [Nippostrongylus brasiliensis]|uniref:Skp1-related protein n=1 Tax=Nippostrongylus brasiliensis TaxID=27835 RepID=A0A0N4XY75_NIPBR|nr:hypothetical protein Q1695_007462 [Nippostrongylus brasiliensis]VDL71601.1 unnamed protein product [Nippostrongylus brasiliensis]
MALVTLQSSDGVAYSVQKEIAVLSSLVHDVITHCPEEGDAVVPLPKVPSRALGPIVEWMRRKKQSSTQQGTAVAVESECRTRLSDLSNWERVFFNDLSKDVLFLVLNAANYMGIAGLVAVGSSFIAEMISGMTLSEARDFLNIPLDHDSDAGHILEKYPWISI